MPNPRYLPADVTYGVRTTLITSAPRPHLSIFDAGYQDIYIHFSDSVEKSLRHDEKWEAVIISILGQFWYLFCGFGNCRSLIITAYFITICITPKAGIWYLYLLLEINRRQRISEPLTFRLRAIGVNNILTDWLACRDWRNLNAKSPIFDLFNSITSTSFISNNIN